MSKIGTYILAIGFIFLSGCTTTKPFDQMGKASELATKYPMPKNSAFRSHPNGVDKGKEIRENAIENFVGAVNNLTWIVNSREKAAEVARSSYTHRIYGALLYSAIGRFVILDGLSENGEVTNFERELLAPLTKEMDDYDLSQIRKSNNVISSRVYKQWRNLPHRLLENGNDLHSMDITRNPSCLELLKQDVDRSRCEWAFLSKNNKHFVLETVVNDAADVIVGTQPNFFRKLEDAQTKAKGSSITQLRAALQDNRPLTINYVRGYMDDRGKELFDNWRSSTERMTEVNSVMNNKSREYRRDNQSPMVRNKAIWDPKTKKAYPLTDFDMKTINRVAIEYPSAHFSIRNNRLYIIAGNTAIEIKSLSDNDELSKDEMDALGGWETR